MKQTLIAYLDNYCLDYNHNRLEFLNGKLHFCILKHDDFLSRNGFVPVDIQTVDYGVKEFFYLISPDDISLIFHLQLYVNIYDQQKPITVNNAFHLFNREYDFEAHKLIEVYLDSEKINQYSKHMVVIDHGIFKISIAVDVVNTAGYKQTFDINGTIVQNVEEPEKGDFLYKCGFKLIDVTFSNDRHWNHYEISKEDLTKYISVKLFLKFGYFQKEKIEISYEDLCLQFEKIATKDM